MNTLWSVMKVVLVGLLFITLSAPAVIQAQPATLSLEELANATYINIHGAPVTLVDGSYEDVEIHQLLQLTDQVLYGDFNGDDSEEAAVILTATSEGVEEYAYLAIVEIDEENGTPTNTNTIKIGERVVIDEFALEDDIILVYLSIAGPTDAPCCPTVQVRQNYKYVEGVFERTRNVILGSTADDPSPLSIEAFANATYPDYYAPYTLVDGEYVEENGDYVNSTYLFRTPAYGDLNGDGVDDAAVIVASTNDIGGSVYLYPIVNNAGVMEIITPTLMNGMVPVRNAESLNITSIEIVDGQIIVNRLEKGPQDKVCCSLEKADLFIMVDGRLHRKFLATDVAQLFSDMYFVYSRPEIRMITLVDGFYVEQSSEGISILNVALSGFITAGDITGDGFDEEVMVLMSTEDGTVTYDLYVFSLVYDVMNYMMPELLGENIELHNLSIVDGELVVDMAIAQGEDAACCPTKVIRRYYTMEEDVITLKDEQEIGTVLPGAGHIFPGGELDETGDPLVATLNLGGADNTWLDPTILNVRSSVLNGKAVDAQSLDEACTGWIAERPDVVMNWEEESEADELHILFQSIGHHTVVVTTPAGDVLCNDNDSPAISAPYLEIPNPEAGRYAIYIGSFADAPVTPGFLVVSGQKIDPATSILQALLPSPSALLTTTQVVTNISGLYDRGGMSGATGGYNPPTYTVALGDDFANIARRFGVSVDLLVHSNKIWHGSFYPGMTLNIPGSGGTVIGPQVLDVPFGTQRLEFEPGLESITLTDEVAPHLRKHYLISALEGEQINVHATSSNGNIEIQVIGPDNKYLTLMGEKSGKTIDTWTAQFLPLSGDYLIRVIPYGSEQTIQFEITIDTKFKLR